MICPHCRKPINKRATPAQKKEMLRLSKEGYSCRDIASFMGGLVSFSTVSRVLRDMGTGNEITPRNKRITY